MSKKNNINPGDMETQIISPKKNRGKKDSSSSNPVDSVQINLYDESEFYIALRGIDVYAEQILGSRANQQDSFAISSGSGTDLLDENMEGWAVVCDGMGGMASGDLASKAAIDVMQQVLKNKVASASVNELLGQAIEIANEEVKAISAQHGDSGTTLVCAIAHGSDLYYASVGDSRIYICRQNEIVRLTRDHNYALELDERVANGEISLSEAMASSQREALISYIGMDEIGIVDIAPEPLKMINDDIVILCSDGLTKVLSDEEIMHIINANRSNIRAITKTLLAAVQRDPSRKLDNTTIAVLKYINN